MVLAQHRIQFVTQAIVQRQILPQFEAVLGKETETAGVKVAMGVAHELQGAAGKAFSKIDQSVGNALWVVGATKTNLTAEGQIIKPVELGIADVGANLKDMSGGGVGNIVHHLEGVDGSAAGLIDRSTQVAHGCAAGDESAGERKLRNISQAERRPGGPPGVQSEIGCLRPSFGRQLDVGSGESQASFVQRSGSKHTSVGDGHQVIGAVVIDSISWDIGSALSRREGEEYIGTGSTIACRKIVRAAQTMVDLHQELVRRIALLGRGNKVAAGITQIGFRKYIQQLRVDGVHANRDPVSLGIREVAGSLVERRDIGDAGDACLPPKAFIIQEKEGAVLYNRPAQRASELVQV